MSLRTLTGGLSTNDQIRIIAAPMNFIDEPQLLDDQDANPHSNGLLYRRSALSQIVDCRTNSLCGCAELFLSLLR